MSSGNEHYNEQLLAGTSEAERESDELQTKKSRKRRRSRSLWKKEIINRKRQGITERSTQQSMVNRIYL